MFVTLGISCGLTFFGFLFRKSIVLALIILLWMWVLWGWNSANADYEAYNNLYNNVLNLISFNYEPGYKILMLLGKVFDLSFQEFLKCISLLVILLWGRFIIKICQTPALFLSLFLWIYFPLDYVQIRNSLAFGIVLQGIYSFIKNTRFSEIKLTGCILLACTIHSSATFYLLLLFSPLVTKFSRSKFLFLLFVGIFILLFLKNPLTAFLAINTEDRTSNYQTSTPLFIIYSILDILNYVFVTQFTIVAKIKNASQQIEFSKLRNYNLLLLLLIPLFLIAGIVIRILRNMSILNIVLITNFLDQYKVKYDYYILISIYCFTIIYYFIIPVFNGTLLPLYKNNLIFN